MPFLRLIQSCFRASPSRRLVLSRFYATIPVKSSSLSNSPPDIEAFRQRAFIPAKPLFFKSSHGSPASQLPARDSWFACGRLSSSVLEFRDWAFPYELVIPPTTPGHDNALAAFRDELLSSQDMADQILAGVLEPALAEAQHHSFFQLYAPLDLLVKALEFNARSVANSQQPILLYVAQSSLSDLPKPLQDELPTPELVKTAGKGDVYSSSLWLGTEPTYTPLHRDPNPNIFCQIHSSKVVRLLPPSLGEQLFIQVQARIHQQANSRIRSSEMMEGKEREELHRAVWDANEKDQFFEAELDAGDALFIPKGWWHSVKSKASQGGLNGSVNWWFR